MYETTLLRWVVKTCWNKELQKWEETVKLKVKGSVYKHSAPVNKVVSHRDMA